MQFTAKEPYKWEILSITRFFLAFVVLAEHLTSFTTYTGPMIVIKQLGAFEAVLGFLLISGFSIGKSILKNESAYFKRRIRRIYPVYVAGMIIAYLVAQSPFTAQLAFILILNMVFLNQVFVNTSFAGIPAWTLALEVWLYMLAPVLLKLSYKTLIVIIYLSFACYCLYTCGRTLFHWPYYAGTIWGINLLLLSFIWIAGFSLAVFKNKFNNISYHIIILLGIHLLLTYVIQILFRIKHHEITMLFNQDIWGFFGEALCLFITFNAVVLNRIFIPIGAKAKIVFNQLGNISYPLYITHWPVLILCKRLHIDNWLFMMAVCLIVALVVYLLFDFYKLSRAGYKVPPTIPVPA